MDLLKYFSDKVRNKIDIKYEPAEDVLPLGSSKFGGNPHLPADFIWPYFEGAEYGDVPKNRPLAFLAQINLKEIQECDKDHELPSEGFLYFFYDVITMLWGFDPKDKGCARVFYYSGDVNDLQVREIPGDMEEYGIIPEFSLDFSSMKSVPAYEELMEDCFEYETAECDTFCEQYDWDAYEKEAKNFGCERVEEAEYCCKLLGYADLIQGSMLMECEQASNGIYCGSGNPDLSEAQKAELQENSKDWVLLFQMGTVENEEYELMFGDCGCIYFYIKKEDLKKRNFDNIWLILQCY